MMVFSCIHTRLTRTSSDLRILSAVLLPPSPVLKADDLLISSTSGEIPILFEATTHVSDFPHPFREPPRSWSLGGGLKMTDEPDTTADIGNPTRGDDSEAPPKNWVGMEIFLTAKLSNNRHAESPRNTFLVGNVAGELENVSHPAYYDFLGGDAECLCTLDDCSLPIVEKQSDFKALKDPQTSCPYPTAPSSTPVVPEEDGDGDQPSMITTFYTYSTLPTPTFAPPSPSPSADVISPSSSPTSRQRHRRPLERAGAVRLPGRPRSPRLQVNDVEAHPVRHASPQASPTKNAHSRWQLADSASMAPTYSCITDTVHSHMKHVVLPEELSWLQHVMIELWIDQEGFRAVRPCMQLMGYSPRTRSLHPYESAEDAGPDVTAGVAEFMPTKRGTFAFHYATLDSPPTLRMVSVAGDESRDYISRQATLSVKVNGVYTVLGTEAFIASILNNDAHGSRIQNVRLRWKFDYLVSDRKVDGTGKTLPGEKTLTPLTFSCSPYLFHPLQGKKAGLMHIMKKNLVPKLGSQKLEPPTCYASSRSILPRTSRHLSVGRNVATHARSHSDAFAKGAHCPLTRSPLDTGGTTQGTDRAQRVRRRRASSAGEDSLPCLRNEPRRGGPGGLGITSPALFH